MSVRHRAVFAATLGIVGVLSATPAWSADQTWSGASSTDFNTTANWVGNFLPGASSGTSNGDTATFNNNVNPAITLSAYRNLKNFLFDTGAGAFSFSGSSQLALTNGGTITLNSGVANSITFNTPLVLSTTGNSTYGFINNSTTSGVLLNIAGSITGQAAQTLTLGGTSSGTVSGAIANGTGTVAVTKSGAGTWTLLGTNTYSGTTTVNAGTLKLDFSAAGAPTGATGIVSSSSTLKLGGGTLQIVGASGGSTQAFASTSFTAATGGQTVISAATTSGTNPIVNLGTLTGTQGALVRFDGAAYNNGASSGTTLGGNTVAATATFNATSNTLAGGIITSSTVSSGYGAYATVGLYDWAAISTGVAGTAQSGTIVGLSQISGGYTVVNSLATGLFGGNYDLTANAQVGGGSTSISGGIGTIRFNTAAAITLTAGRATGNSVLGAILVTPNVGANNTTIALGNGVPLQASRATGGATGFTLVQNNTLGELLFNSGYANGSNSAATASYTQGGPGTVVMGATNTYTGLTYLDGGTTVITSNAQIGALATAAAVNLNGGSLFGNATFTLDNAGANSRPVVLNGAGGTLAASTSNTVTVNGIVSGSGDLRIGTGTIAGTGAGTANTTAVIGNGTVVLNNAGNSYTGGTTVNAGTLQLQGAIGVLGTGNLTLNGGTFQYGSSTTTDISARTITLASTSTIDTNGNSVSFANSIGNGGAGGLVKAGSGSLTLAGANNYSGPTSISGGSLLVTNVSGSATGTGGVTANSGGTLGGTGTVSGAVTVNNGGRVSPGVGGVGTLNVGTLTLAAGSQLDFDITSTATLDRINVNTSGGLTINGGQLNINGGGTAFTTNGVYNLIGYTGAIGGTGGVGALTLNGTNSVLTTNTYTFGAAGGFVTLTIANSGATPNYWNADANGNWSDTAKWTLGVAPNVVGAFAAFGGGGTAITAPRTITVDGAYTVGTLGFNNPTKAYTLAAGVGGTIILDNDTNSSFVNTTAGSHTVQVPLTMTTNGAAFSVVGAVDTLTVSGTVTGTGAGLTKTGLGTLALTGVNTYTGGTNLNAGTIQINSADSLGDVAGNLVFGGGTLQLLADVSTARNYQVSGASNAVINTNGFSQSISGVISPLGGGTGGVVKNGLGTLALSGTNTYTGTTTINAGTVSIAANANLGAPATGAGINLAGGTLASTANVSLNNGAIGTNDRPITLGTGGGTLAPASGTTLTLSGAITGSTKLTKADAGQVTIYTPVAAQNTYSGGTLVSAGKILLTDANSNNTGLGTGAVTLDGGTLQLFSTGPSATGSGTFANNIVVDSTYTGTLIGFGRGTISSSLTGAGTFNYQTDYVRAELTGNWGGFTGQINVTKNVNGGDFRLNSGFGFGTAKLNLGPNVGMYEVNNFGAGGMTLAIGELTGDATSSISGGPTGGRTLTYSVGSANTTAQYDGRIIDGSGPTAITKTGTGTWSITNSLNTYTGATAISGGVLQVGNGGTTGTLGTGGLVTNNASLVFNRSDTLTVNNTITGTGSVTQAGGSSSVTVLTAGNSYTGQTFINSGTLNINGQYALGGGAYGGTTFNGGTLQYAANLPSVGNPGFNGTGDISVDSFNNPKPVTINVGGATIDTNGNAVTYASTIGNGGAGGLTKTGAGTLALNATNTYAGNTTVNGGTLLANGTSNALGTGNATIASGGQLAGTGKTGGNVSAAAGSVISAGSGATLPVTTGGLVSEAVGNLTIGNGTNSGTLTLAPQSAYRVKFATAGNDKLTMQTLNLTTLANTDASTRSSIVVLNKDSGAFNYAPGAAYTYTIASTTAAGGYQLPSGYTPLASLVAGKVNVTDLFTLDLTNVGLSDSSGFSVLLASAGGGGYDMQVYYDATPEPTTAALFLLGASPLLTRRRSRKVARAV